MRKYDEDRSLAAIAFLNAVIALERAYGFSIGHEDEYGSFLVESYDELNAAWLLAAGEEVDVQHGLSTPD